MQTNWLGASPEPAPAALVPWKTMISNRSLEKTKIGCCLCQNQTATEIGSGEDFEYRVSDDTWHIFRCNSCRLLFLNPRPADSELDTIYPASYHAFAFTDEEFGFVNRVRRRLEASRLLKVFSELPATARILDVGCGDGFHLKLLRQFGPKGWSLSGVDTSSRAVERARSAGLDVHQTTLQEAPFEPNSVDAVILIQTLEHLGDPVGVLKRIHELLKPGGRLLIVTDNARSLDAWLFQKRYWGGYHFPRHWNLFNPSNIRILAEQAGFRVHRLRTIVSPVNWVYSIRNYLEDRSYPSILVERFSLRSPVGLAVFTLLDNVFSLFGNAALMQCVLEKSS